MGEARDADIQGQGALATTGSPRLVGLDAMRALALLAVVYLHAPEAGDASLVIEQLTRFAVPFFFLASGYLLGLREEPAGPAVRRLTRRILPVYLAWLCIYNFIPDALMLASDPAAVLNRDHLIGLIGGGQGYHLWFLPELLVSSIVVAVLRRRLWMALGLGALLYGAGLALGLYAPTLGLPQIDPRLLRGAMGPLFVAAGALLGRRAAPPALTIAIGITALGVILQLTECRWLGYGASLHRDITLGAAILGLGALMVALNIPATAPARGVAWFGRYGLGIYCIHLLALKTLAGLIPLGGEVSILILVLLAFAASIAFALTAAQVRWLRPLIV